MDSIEKTSLIFTGASKTVLELQAKHISVTFFCRRPDSTNFSIERLFAAIRSKLPSNIICSVAVSPFFSRGFLRRIINILRAPLLQGDINHITGDVYYIALLLSKGKTILTIHDCVSLERLQGIKRSLLMLFWYILPVKKSAIITVISQSTKQELLRYVKCDPEKIRVIHDCIPDDFKPCPKLFNMKKPVLLQVGTGENKNLIRVVEALKEVSCHLRIIGKLNYRQLEVLSEYQIEYSSIADISNEDIVKEYQQSDMLVFVSTYEGFGLPIVEANAVGRPVITGNILSMPEVAGNAACLVDPFSVDEIRSGILRILTDDAYRNELVNNGYMNAQRFQPGNIAGQYATLYEELYRCNHVMSH